MLFGLSFKLLGDLFVATAGLVGGDVPVSADCAGLKDSFLIYHLQFKVSSENNYVCPVNLLKNYSGHYPFLDKGT